MFLPRPLLPIILLVAVAPALPSAQSPTDHEHFSELLGQIVQDSLSDYQALLENEVMLDAYVESLDRTDIDTLESATHRVQLANPDS